MPSDSATARAQTQRIAVLAASRSVRLDDMSALLEPKPKKASKEQILAYFARKG